ncbi:hypothetical protein D3C77_788350 [compost metagenome]
MRKAAFCSSLNARFSTGKIHCAVRWKCLSLPARAASAETICTPVEPLPTMPMRRPSSGML